MYDMSERGTPLPGGKRACVAPMGAVAGSYLRVRLAAAGTSSSSRPRVVFLRPELRVDPGRAACPTKWRRGGSPGFFGYHGDRCGRKDGMTPGSGDLVRLNPSSPRVAGGIGDAC
jgi:hypothetical protein